MCLLIRSRSGNLLISQVIQLLAEGKVSLLTAPPLYGSDAEQRWMVSQTKLLSLDAVGLLKECLSSFDAHHSNTPAAQLSSAVHGEIFHDLLDMQTQPQIRQTRRRFVIITTTSTPVEKIDANRVRDGVNMN